MVSREFERMAAPILDVLNLHKRFGATIALNGVSFQVAEGEIFGLLGPNGAGKTTLLSIVSCLLEASAGETRIHGRPVSMADKELRRHIGIVPQELALYDELSARENIIFFGRLYGLRGKELDQRVQGVLAAVGLEDPAERRVATFSGGMKRRLNLGAALDHGRLIACDEVPQLLRKQDGVIRFRVPQVTSDLRARVRQIPDSRLVETDSRPLEIVCRDVKTTLAQLLTVLAELKIETISLETEEPNLEQVFLGLTGSALRD